MESEGGRWRRQGRTEGAINRHGALDDGEGEEDEDEALKENSEKIEAGDSDSDDDSDGDGDCGGDGGESSLLGGSANGGGYGW